MKKQTRFILLLFCGLILLFWLQKPDDKLHLIFCDVGQGDAILITHKNDQILIDGGPDESVLACLSRHLPFWDRKIELVLLTHPDSDHFFGLAGVVERYTVGKFIANPFITSGNPDLEKLARLIKEKEINLYSPSQGDKIRLGEIKLNVLWPEKTKLEEIEKLSSQATGKTGGFWVFDSSLVEPNQYSIAVNLNYGNFDALLTGDLPAEESQLLSWHKKLFPVDVLKASHHGSGKDNPEELYRETKPEMVVFSVGKNSFGHPNAELIDKLKKTGVETRRTDLGRDVETVSDGKTWLEYN